MKNHYLIIKKLEGLEDLKLLKEGDVVRTLRGTDGTDKSLIELRVYAGKTRDKRMEFLNITGLWPSPISGWLIEDDSKKISIKNYMLNIHFFSREVETKLYTTKGQIELCDYTEKRKIIDKSGISPDYRWEELIKG